jgi:serine/threonine protein kinase
VFPAYQADLFVVLSKTGRLQEPVARYYFKQLIDGLQHIHNKGFAHRNLKPKNLFIDDKDDFNMKIADFVFASSLEETSKTFVGTIDYMSPEIHLKMFHQPGKADVFALGVILFNMVTGQAPF